MGATVMLSLLRSQASRMLLVTAGVLLVYRLGCQIPTLGVDVGLVTRLQATGSIEYFSIFALGVVPFLSVLMLFEATKLVFPPLARWEASDIRHARRLHGWVFLLALTMAAFQARGLVNALYEINGLFDGPGWTLPNVATLIAATALLGWLADCISRYGVGGGFWALLIVPTLAGLPSAVALAYEASQRGIVRGEALVAAVVLLAAATMAIVAVNHAAQAAAAASAEPNFRVTGADFTTVWPPLLATALGDFTLNLWAAMQPPGAQAPLALDNPVRLAVIAALIAIFAFLQSRGGGPSGPIRITVLVQIAVCIGCDVITQTLALPLAISGVWLIIIVTTMMNALRRLQAAMPAEPEGKPAL